MLFNFQIPVLIRHLWHNKMLVLQHRCLIHAVSLDVYAISRADDSKRNPGFLPHLQLRSSRRTGHDLGLGGLHLWPRTGVPLLTLLFFVTEKEQKKLGCFALGKLFQIDLLYVGEAIRQLG
jgi:hypothetical protein